MKRKLLTVQEERSDAEEGSDYEPEDSKGKNSKPSKILAKRSKRVKEAHVNVCGEDAVERVETITKDRLTKELYGLVLFNTGVFSSHPIEELKINCPQKVRSPILG
jgi:hypothetical protein